MQKFVISLIGVLLSAHTLVDQPPSRPISEAETLRGVHFIAVDIAEVPPGLDEIIDTQTLQTNLELRMRTTGIQVSGVGVVCHTP